MISIYNPVSNNKIEPNAIIGLTKTINITAYTGYTSDNDKDDKGNIINGKAQSKYSLTAVLDELPALSYSTSWDLSPVAKIDTFVKDKTTKDIISSVASLTKSKHYDTPIANDEWSQLFPKDGSTIKFDIKFTAYYKKMLNTSNYFKIIRNILLGLAPKHHEITDYADQIATSVITADRIGHDYESYKSPGKKGFDGIKADFLGEDNLFSSVKKILKIVFDTESDIPLNVGTMKEELLAAKKSLNSFFTNIENCIKDSENTGGVDRYKVKIPNVIDNTDANWFFYITNFSFTPSMNTVMYQINNNNIEVPISMDFNITLESDRVLTNYELDRSISH